MNLWLLNKDFENVAVLDQYESFIWTDRYNEAGDFEMVMVANTAIAGMVEKDFYIVSDDSDRMMVVERIEIETDSEDGNKIIFTGNSLETFLKRRIVWGFKTFTDSNFQDAIETLLNENVINPSDEKRKIPNFIFKRSDDERITKEKLKAQYTGENLYSIIERTCQEKNIGFKVVLDEEQRFVFSLYCGEKRTYDQTVNPYVIFSPKFDNIISSRYLNTDQDYYNVGLVAGEGSENERDFLGIGLAVEGLNRRELFIDAGDISHRTEGDTEIGPEKYKELLDQRGREELAKTKRTRLFEGEVEGTILFKYRRDYFMGDIVQVENEYGFAGESRVTELVISQSKDKIAVYPTFTNLDEEGEPI